jgi:hypothetical protein
LARREPFVVALATPHRPIERRAALSFAAAGALLFASTFSRSALVLQALGAGTAGFALYLLWSALRVRGWKDFRIVLGDETIEVPMVPLLRRESVRLKLDEIEMVTYAASGDRPRIQILTRQGIWLVPFDWFEKGSSPVELALRIHVRSQLARAGQTLGAGELAALEATLIAGKSYGAFVVERLGEPPEVVATLDRASEKEAVADKLKGRGAKLYDCSERILALRDALERGLAAPSLPHVAAPKNE